MCAYAFWWTAVEIINGFLYSEVVLISNTVFQLIKSLFMFCDWRRPLYLFREHGQGKLRCIWKMLCFVVLLWSQTALCRIKKIGWKETLLYYEIQFIFVYLKAADAILYDRHFESRCDGWNPLESPDSIGKSIQTYCLGFLKKIRNQFNKHCGEKSQIVAIYRKPCKISVIFLTQQMSCHAMSKLLDRYVP